MYLQYVIMIHIVLLHPHRLAFIMEGIKDGSISGVASFGKETPIWEFSANFCGQPVK